MAYILNIIFWPTHQQPFNWIFMIIYLSLVFLFLSALQKPSVKTNHLTTNPRDWDSKQTLQIYVLAVQPLWYYAERVHKQAVFLTFKPFWLGRERILSTFSKRERFYPAISLIGRQALALQRKSTSEVCNASKNMQDIRTVAALCSNLRSRTKI